MFVTRRRRSSNVSFSLFHLKDLFLKKAQTKQTSEVCEGCEYFCKSLTLVSWSVPSFVSFLLDFLHILIWFYTNTDCELLYTTLFDKDGEVWSVGAGQRSSPRQQPQTKHYFIKKRRKESLLKYRQFQEGNGFVKFELKMKFTEALRQTLNQKLGFMFEKCLKMDRLQVQLNIHSFTSNICFSFWWKSFKQILPSFTFYKMKLIDIWNLF